MDKTINLISFTFFFAILLFIQNGTNYQKKLRFLISVKVNKKKIPLYLVLITTCDSPKTVINYLTKNKINCLELECHNETKRLDCVQTIRILEFFVQNYYNDLAEIYVITDDHINHWHHGNILNGINNALQNNYFVNYSYNGYFDIWNDDFFTKKSKWDTQNPSYSFFDLMDYFYNDTNIDWKGHNYYPCCTSFFVRAENIRFHSIDFYKKLIAKGRDWSLKHNNWHPYPGYYCGRIFEYSFHLMFTGNKYIEKPPKLYPRK